MKSNERGNAIAVSREAMPRNANYLSPLPFHASIISNRTKLQIIINIKCDKCPNHPTPYKKIPSIRISTLHEPSWESLHLRHRSAGGAISLHPTARAVGKSRFSTLSRGKPGNGDAAVRASLGSGNPQTSATCEDHWQSDMKNMLIAMLQKRAVPEK